MFGRDLQGVAVVSPRATAQRAPAVNGVGPRLLLIPVILYPAILPKPRPTALFPQVAVAISLAWKALSSTFSVACQRDAEHFESIGLLIMPHKGKVGWGGWEIGRFRAGIRTGSELPETYTQFSRIRAGDAVPVPIPAITGWIFMPRRPLKTRISFCGAIHFEPTGFRIAIGAAPDCPRPAGARDRRA